MAQENKDKNRQDKLSLKFIVDVLQKVGMIDKADADEILAQKVSAGEHPLVSVSRFHLIDARPPHGELDMEYLLQWFSKFTGKQYTQLEGTQFDFLKASELISKEVATKYSLIPIRETDDWVVIGTADPYRKDWIPVVETACGKKVLVQLINPVHIDYFLSKIYGVAVKSKGQKPRLTFKTSTAQVSSSRLSQMKFLMDKFSKGKEEANEGVIENLVHNMIVTAYEKDATDIHIEPKEKDCLIRYRIDGDLHTVLLAPPNIYSYILGRIKIMCNMKVDERRLPQDGRIKIKDDTGKFLDLRVSTLPVYHGEKIALRLFTSSSEEIEFDDLGFFPDDIKKWKFLLERPNGIVLVTGPTGSGKSTTLSASLRYLSSPNLNISTVEDPVEQVNNTINQTQVNSAIGMDFARSLRALLRQDPDIIMVGEIRDKETAKIALEAALTGHLVLSTLHTNSAADSLIRLVDLGVPDFLITSSILGIIGQRLARKLCDECKEKVKVDPGQWKFLSGPYIFKTPEFIYKAVGCKSCYSTGHKGRVVLYELLNVTNEHKSIIVSNQKTDEIVANLQKTYRTLRFNAAFRVANGQISIEEAIKFVR